MTFLSAPVGFAPSPEEHLPSVQLPCSGKAAAPRPVGLRRGACKQVCFRGEELAAAVATLLPSTLRGPRAGNSILWGDTIAVTQRRGSWMGPFACVMPG